MPGDDGLGAAIMVLFFVVFLGILTLFTAGIIKAIIKHRTVRRTNLASPPLSRPARVVAKRSSVSGSENSTSTSYFATFEFADGSRTEFELKGAEYGTLAEGDAGVLHNQGTWFRGFDRNSQIQDRRI